MYPTFINNLILKIKNHPLFFYIFSRVKHTSHSKLRNLKNELNRRVRVAHVIT